MLVASSMVQIVLGEPSQLTTKITQDYGILETGTVPISGTLTANDPSDTYGTWGGGVTKISMQIYWTPSNKGIYVGFYDVTHNTLYYTGPIYGGATFVTFFVPAGHDYCQWQVWIWASLSGSETIQYHGTIYVIWE
jgi:hypothetical protein